MNGQKLHDISGYVCERAASCQHSAHGISSSWPVIVDMQASEKEIKKGSLLIKWNRTE